MAHSKSAQKRILQAEAATQRNRVRKARVKSADRKLTDALSAKDPDAAKVGYSALCSALDKAAKGGAIKKETATRRKNRAAERMRNVLA